MHEEINHNDLQSIITHALEEMKQDLGEKFDPDHVNLAELGRRTNLSRGKLRRIQKNGFVVTPHARKGTRATSTVLSGYTGVINDLLLKGVSNSMVCFERIKEIGYPGSLSTVKTYITEHIRGKDVELLRNLPTLSALYAHKNLAFIGPQGVGKTHLAMAFGRECCLKGMKAYYLKASELNQKFTNARKYGNEGSAVNGLVKPSCLIIDEVGRCLFDEANTRLFFDVIDRRNEKEGPNCMIFTSNKSPNTWRQYFKEDDSLLCALDRIFDDATVYLIKGKSYRGRKLKTVALEAGIETPAFSQTK